MKYWPVAIGVIAMAVLAGWRTTTPSTDPCQPLTVEGTHYLICTLASDRYQVSIGHNDPAAGPSQTVADHLARMETGGRAPVLVVNGGMYHRDLSPVGLLMEQGQVITPLNQADASGNFYLKPNGVFWVDAAGRGHVTETGQFVGAQGAARDATQSGPLLVQGGQLHPALQPNGPSRLIRNGVGVSRDGEVVLVLSRSPVSLGAMARLFRDQLDCPDALYLDGVVSALAFPDHVVGSRSSAAGPVIRVELR